MPGPQPYRSIVRSSLRLGGGDDNTVRHILATFRAGNDQDAAKLRQAVAASDMFQVTHCAHRMLGASRMVGAQEFAGVCEQIHYASRAGDWNIVNDCMQAFEREWERLNAYFDSVVSG